MFKCEKCDKSFKNSLNLRRHQSQRKKSCVGTWYICKRCLEFFETESSIKEHQTRHGVCLFNETAGTTAGTVPVEAKARIRYQRGIRDCGGEVAKYFDHMFSRFEEEEMKSVLCVCEMSDLDVFLKVSTASPKKIEILSFLTNILNGDDMSPERSSLLRKFILQETTI